MNVLIFTDNGHSLHTNGNNDKIFLLILPSTNSSQSKSRFWEARSIYKKANIT